MFCHSVVQYWGQLGEEREWWYPPTVCKSLTYEMFSERLMELISSKRSCRTFFLINIQESNDGNFIKMFPSLTDAVTGWCKFRMVFSLVVNYITTVRKFQTSFEVSSKSLTRYQDIQTHNFLCIRSRLSFSL